jgi:alpha-beta hydrolase superfamily lysophospholipase/thiol-disulfide isomerase/thioredoxin
LDGENTILVLIKRSLVSILACTCLLSGAPLDVRAFSRHSEKHESKQEDQLAASVGNGSAPCISWVSPVMKPRAVLLCIHGLGLYSGSYANFGKNLSRLGISVYAIDVRGFGSWMQNRGHEKVDFDACLNDVKTTLISIRAANPGLPVFLLGESMGGAISLRVASLYPDLIAGLVSAVPSGDRFKQKKTDLKVAIDFLKGPNKQFDVGPSLVDQATNNPKLRDDWVNNPLDRMDLSAKELIQFQSFMNENHDSAKKITDLSVMMVEGNKDKLVKPEGTWDLFNDIASPEKTFLAIPSEHLIYEEQQDKERIHDARINRLTAAWILSHVVQAVEEQKGILGTNDTINFGNQQNNNIYNATSNGTSNSSNGNSNSTSNNRINISDTSISVPVGAGQSLPLSGSPQRDAYYKLTEGTPTVIAFYAPWAEQCKDIKPFFNRIESRFGSRLKLLQVDIDDDGRGEALVKDFGVGAIPTFVFLTANGKLAKTTIGMPSFMDFAKNVSTILP